MSAVRRAAVKVVAKKPRQTKQAVVEPAVEAPAPVVEAPVPAPAPAPATPAVVVESTPTYSHISSARVRQYLDKGSMNKVINDSYKSMKAELNAYKAATEALASGKVKTVVKVTVDGQETSQEVLTELTDTQRAQFEETVTRVTPFLSEYSLKMDALSRERERFSSEAPVVLSIVCDQLVRQLVTHTIEHALSKGKKIIQVSHVHTDGVEKLPLYKLVATLPSFKHYSDLYAAKKGDDDLLKLRKKVRAEAWSEYRKLYNLSLVREQKKQKNPAAAPALQLPVKGPEEVACAEEPEVDDSHVDNKSTFHHYVSNECKSITSEYEAKHGKLRVSADIKKYLSDLLIEFIERMSTLISLTTSTMTRKTVNNNAIMRTVEKLLVDGHKPVETLTFELTDVPDPEVKTEELKKKAEAEARGEKYKVDLNAIRKVKGYVAVRTVKYPTSGFDELQALVNERLEVYRKGSSEKSK